MKWKWARNSSVGSLVVGYPTFGWRPRSVLAGILAGALDFSSKPEERRYDHLSY